MTQTDAILAHLSRGESITPLEALQLYGCFRLAARVRELRKDGLTIHSEMVKTANGKRIARYSMEGIDG